MTTLFSWTGIDTHGPASIYIASDSRISWGKSNTWDLGRKLFASTKYPELFGYCGSVTFPIQILGQLIEHIDNELLFQDYDSISKKIECVRSQIEKSYTLMPEAESGECKIFYATRIGQRMNSRFHAARIIVNKESILAEEVELPKKSGLIASAGSGKAALLAWNEEWTGKQNSDNYQTGRTSRNVFSAFCDSLESGQDPYSGGSPQLIGIYREGPARKFGVIYRNKRYFNGIEVEAGQANNSIEWRNALFERCCGLSMSILTRAQRQPKLKGIKIPEINGIRDD